MTAAPQMREKIDVPALAPESGKIGDRRFRAGQDDERRIDGQGLARPDHDEAGPRFRARKGSRSSKLAMRGSTGTAIVTGALVADDLPAASPCESSAGKRAAASAQKGMSPRPGQPVQLRDPLHAAREETGIAAKLIDEKPAIIAASAGSSTALVPTIWAMTPPRSMSPSKHHRNIGGAGKAHIGDIVRRAD